MAIQSTAVPTIDQTAVQAFATALRGQLLRPGDRDYDAARRVWNAMIDRRPALIARCAGTADVAAAVNFARQHGLLVSVKGGGHSVAGRAVCEGGLMIDLSPMKGIEVDPAGRAVRAGGGVTWGELDQASQLHGLATTGGIVPTTGIAGLTLGGGIGYLARRFGLACDNLHSVDVVTADGQVLVASESENADLFWALRGGSGNFGVVTSLEFHLHSVGPTVIGGFIFHPFSHARELLQFYRQFVESSPEELAVVPALATSPEGQLVVVLIVCFSGPVEAGEQVIRPLRQYGQPIADTIGPLPYTEVQAFGAPLYPPGRLNYWKSGFLSKLSDEVIDELIAQFASVPSPMSALAIEYIEGAPTRVAPAATAFGERRSPYNLVITGEWTDPADSDRNIAWVRNCWEAVRPHAAGSVYVNYVDADEEDRTQAAYGGNYDRLAEVKAKYDPTNFFRHNQNIQPKA